jgi:hypothetical protein
MSALKASYEASVQLAERRVPLHLPVELATGQLGEASDIQLREGAKDLTHELARRLTRFEGRKDVGLYDVAQRALADRCGFTLHEGQDYRRDGDE